MDDNYKMALVVNNSLRMTTGKVASQCCHACLGVYEKTNSKNIKIWKQQGQPKIVLKCNNDVFLLELEQMAIEYDIPCYIVYDAGITQVKKDSATVCALGPAPNNLINSLTKNLKVL